MTPARPHPATTRAATACLVVAAALAGCASPRTIRSDVTSGSETVSGNYEVLAGCVADAGGKSTGGAPALRVDRGRKTATVQRVNQPSNELQYEIAFTQTGASTVHVDGRANPASSDGARGFAFLWPHVGLCATDIMAP